MTVKMEDIKKEVLRQVELANIQGQLEGIRDLKRDLFPDNVEGSAQHPVATSIKPVDLKSITVELEDNQLVLKLGSEIRNKHVTPVADTKFTQLLMMIKDQFSNWNSSNNKRN